MRKVINNINSRITKTDERGLSLLEYAVGAAVLAGIVVTAMNAFGTGLSAYFSNLGVWISGLSIGS